VLRLAGVPAAVAGQQFEVWLGETLQANKSVMWKGTVRVFRHEGAPHTRCIPLGYPLPRTVPTVNCAQTLKARVQLPGGIPSLT
jgi:hypothetical protein